MTGGGSGIGLRTARRLAADGAQVACLDLDPDGRRGPLIGIVCDLTDDASVRAAIAAAAERLGGIDVLVNNAGIGAAGTVADNDDAEWHRVLDVNVVGMVRASRAALPHLKRSDRAAIVNTGSIAATAGLPQRALYSASKGAVQALTLAMAADHLERRHPRELREPGTADTPWVQRLLDAADDPAAERAALEARQPIGRLVERRRGGRGHLLISPGPDAASTTGTVLAVDGGMHGLRPRPA